MNISFEQDGRTRRARTWPKNFAAAALDVYQRGAELARQRGIIIADTKFEWGRVDGRADSDRRSADARQLAILAGRSVSSPAAASRRTTSNSSATGSRRPTWDKNSTPPELPDDVVTRHARKIHRSVRAADGRKVRLVGSWLDGAARSRLLAEAGDFSARDLGACSLATSLRFRSASTIKGTALGVYAPATPRIPQTLLPRSCCVI